MWEDDSRYDRAEDALNIFKYITEDFNVKHTNITTAYNQYLIINYLQKILKLPSIKAWVWEIKNLQIKGEGVRKDLIVSLELLIKIAEGFT